MDGVSSMLMKAPIECDYCPCAAREVAFKNVFLVHNVTGKIYFQIWNSSKHKRPLLFPFWLILHDPKLPYLHTLNSCGEMVLCLYIMYMKWVTMNKQKDDTPTIRTRYFHTLAPHHDLTRSYSVTVISFMALIILVPASLYSRKPPTIILGHAQRYPYISHGAALNGIALEKLTAKTPSNVNHLISNL